MWGAGSRFAIRENGVRVGADSDKSALAYVREVRAS